MHCSTWDYAKHLELASAVAERFKPMIFLHSSMQSDYSGSFSFLCFDAYESSSNSFHELNEQLNASKASDSDFFGLLSYELKHELEQLEKSSKGRIQLPKLLMHRYNIVMRFDHQLKTCTVFHRSVDDLNKIPKPNTSGPLQCTLAKLESNMTKSEYLQKVRDILEAIHRGDLYQANLTRKFYCEIQSLSSPFSLFNTLCQVSPAPYSAFMQFDDTVIISSSPERFIHSDSKGQIHCQPIKGTAARHPNTAKDMENKARLAESSKDKAENLMIVDLMRHDLSKHCETHSVSVPALYAIHSYETVHHMSSIISGTRKASSSAVDVISACFPPGSMTGAPKIQAMSLCSQLEQVERGVYSGALGYISADGSIDLSVVIRTIIIQGNTLEFQVGGAIVADSEPIKEWQETLNKARGICQTLGLSPEKHLAF